MSPAIRLPGASLDVVLPAFNEAAKLPARFPQLKRVLDSLSWLLHLAINGVTALSSLPLRIWSSIGGLVARAALAYGGWIVIEQLLSIGSMGGHVGRIFDALKQRPLDVVAHDTGKPS
ncbi:MAG: hypothetical protein ACK4R2_05150 [Roseateles sp.]